MTEPAIAIAPYGSKLKGRYDLIPCSEMIWPLGCPERLKDASIGDMGRDDHIILFPKNAFHIRPFHRLKARISLMVQEPRGVHGRHRRWLRFTHRKFFRIFSHDRALVNGISNGVFVPYGTTWVPEWRDLDLTKDRMCSVIASAKRSQPGHVLRHEIIDWCQVNGVAVDALGGGYAPFGDKAEGLAHYRYSVVIENGREPDYFSEKLIDALLCLTVPIYWGCPNIADYIDTSAIIICESPDDIQAALREMTEEDYAARLPALEKAREQALQWVDLEGRTAQALLNAL